MADPFSNQPVISPAALQGISIAPYQQQTSDAIVQLQKAWKDGLVKIEDMQKAGIAPKVIAAQGAKADLERQQAVADQGLVQPKAALEQAKVGSDMQILPDRTAANLSVLKLGTTQAQAQLPGAELEAQEMKQDSTGMLTAARKMYSQYSFGRPLPKKPDGSLDYESMQHQMQEAFFPGSKSTDGTAPHADQSNSAFRTMMLAQMWAADYGKQVAGMAKEKNVEHLMYDANGNLRSPYEAAGEIGKAPVNPKLTADQVIGAQTKGESLGELTNQIGGVQSLLKDHPEYFEGPRTAPVVEWAAKQAGPFTNVLGAHDQAAGQANIGRILNENFLNRIQELRGLGQVRTPELAKIELTPPVMGASTAADWDVWLKNLQKVVKVSQDVNSKVSQGDLTATPKPRANAQAPQASTDYKVPAGVDPADMTLQVKLFSAFQQAGIAPDRAASAVRVRNAADYAKAPSGAIVFNDDGVVKIKP